MKEIKRHLVLNDFEYRLLVGCVNKARTMYIDEGKPIEDVSALLLQIIDAPTKKIKVGAEQNRKIIIRANGKYQISFTFFGNTEKMDDRMIMQASIFIYSKGV